MNTWLSFHQCDQIGHIAYSSYSTLIENKSPSCSGSIDFNHCSTFTTRKPKKWATYYLRPMPTKRPVYSRPHQIKLLCSLRCCHNFKPPWHLSSCRKPLPQYRLYRTKKKSVAIFFSALKIICCQLSAESHLILSSAGMSLISSNIKGRICVYSPCLCPNLFCNFVPCKFSLVLPKVISWFCFLYIASSAYQH